MTVTSGLVDLLQRLPPAKVRKQHGGRKSFRPFRERTCDGEAEHDATNDAEDRPGPANEESHTQLIPAPENSVVIVCFIFGAAYEIRRPQLLLLRHEPRVKKLGGDPVCVQGAGGERAEAWGADKLEDSDTCDSTSDHLTWLTAQDEVHTGQAGNLGLASVAASDFGALHSHQGKYGAEEAQANGGDHQAPACLDVACWWRAQISQGVSRTRGKPETHWHLKQGIQFVNDSETNITTKVNPKISHPWEKLSQGHRWISSKGF